MASSSTGAVEAHPTIYNNESFNGAIDTAQNILDGFESDNVVQNLAAGQAVAQLIRAVASQQNAEKVLQLAQFSLPLVANTLEAPEAMQRTADSLRLLATVLESSSFQRNAAAGLRFASKAIEDEKLGGAIASGMEAASRIMEQPAVNKALERGGAIATSILGNESVQQTTRAVLESETFNTTLNTTVRTGITVAQKLRENERVCQATSTGMDVVTRVLDNATVQSAVKGTVTTTATVAQRLLDSQTLGNAAAAGANMASTVMGSDIVTSAAASTYELAKSMLTSNTVVGTWASLSHALAYFGQANKMRLEELEAELAELEVATNEDLTELRDEERLLAEDEQQKRVAYERARQILGDNRREQAQLEARLKAKRAEVARERAALEATIHQQVDAETAQHVAEERAANAPAAVGH